MTTPKRKISVDAEDERLRKKSRTSNEEDIKNNSIETRSVFEITELALNIFNYLLSKPRSLYNAYRTCKQFHALLSLKSTWIYFGFSSYFGLLATTDEITPAKMAEFFLALVLPYEQAKLKKQNKRTKLLQSQCGNLTFVKLNVPHLDVAYMANRILHDEACLLLLEILKTIGLPCLTLPELIELVSLRTPLSKSQRLRQTYSSEERSYNGCGFFEDLTVTCATQFFPVRRFLTKQDHHLVFSAEQSGEFHPEFGASIWIKFLSNGKTVLFISMNGQNNDRGAVAFNFLKMDYAKNQIEICGSLKNLAELQFSDSKECALSYLEECTLQEAQNSLQCLEMLQTNFITHGLGELKRDLPFRK